jgi:photosystem II stability/assembly factor-like uncharacterized protein
LQSFVRGEIYLLAFGVAFMGEILPPRVCDIHVLFFAARHKNGGLDMKKLLLLPLSSFLFFLVLSTTASAQVGPPSWTPVPMAFFGQIHIVKFLDAEGAPLTGFVGDDTGIWYTTNGGTTWTRATITDPPLNQPIPFPSGWVTDITFEPDAKHGFAVIDSNTTQNGDAGILVTSNGGQSWTFDDNAGTPDSGRGIYYNPTNSRLYVAGADKGLVVSTDAGGTWSVIDTGTSYTGFAFNGTGLGVVATEGSTCVNFPSHKVYWLATTDGGLSWARTSMYTQSWQPLSIPTTETFFASSANNCSGIVNAILRSDVAGNGFSDIPGYTAGASDTLAEDVAGDGCEIFASSFASHVGMWISTNDGANWSTIINSPNPAVDTRFYVSPDTVWSFAYDTLKSFPRPPTADIHVWPDTIAFKNAACLTTSDTTIHIFGCNCANNPTLTGATVTRLTSIVDTISVVATPTIPPNQPLCSGGVPSADGVQLEFQPTQDLGDSANITLKFLDNGVVVDTILHMTANGTSTTLPPFSAHAITLSGAACSGVIDTCINITNESCNTLIIEGSGSILNEDDQCKDLLQVTGFCQLQNQGNITLLPGESWCFPIDFVPGLIVGTCGASVQLEYKTQDGSLDTLTNYLQIVGNTTTNLKPTFRGFNIKKANCCEVPADTTIYFVNITCDTIELKTPIITGNPTCAKNFKIDTTAADNNGFPLTFPQIIAPLQHVPLTISLNCEATDCEAYITFPYTIRATFVSSACASSADSTLFASDSLIDTLSLNVQAVATPAKITSSINFGNVNCCDSTELKTITITAGCKPDTIKAISLANSTGGNFYLDTANLGLPQIIGPGQQLTFPFQVGFLPRCGGGSGATDNGSVTATLSSGTLNCPVGATSTNLATVNPGSVSVNFDSVLSCAGQSCQTFTFTNASCGPIVISVNTPPSHGCLTVSGVTSKTIDVDSSMQVTVCLDPGTCGVTGALSDMAIFQISDPNGTNFTFDTATLAAYIYPPVPLDSVTQLANITICDSSSITESFSVTNLGTCYTYDIVSGTGGNSQVIVTPPSSYPIHIDSGASQSFSVTFSPTSVGNFTGNITLTDADGTTILVPYNFTDTNCTVTGQFNITLNPGNTVTTTPCIAGKIIYTVSAGGGSGMVVGISVIGSNRFFPSGPTSGGAMPFTDTITFDPNQMGGNSALVTLTYSINGGPQMSDTFTVYGAVNGAVDTVHIGVTSPTNTCILPNDTELKEFDVMLRDSIPASLGITQLTFVISYNGNLLFNPQQLGNLPPGWTVTMMDEPDGIHVTMTYTGTAGLPANTPLLELTQLGAVSDSTSSTAKITNPLFNDSMFAACTLEALPSPTDSANICINDSGCGALPLQRDLQGTLQSVSNIMVVPNPAHKGGSAATLHFTTNVAADVSAEVLDVLGNSVLTLTAGSMDIGDHALSIPTDQMPEGAYFARITVNGFTVIRQFVLVKE